MFMNLKRSLIEIDNKIDLLADHFDQLKVKIDKDDDHLDQLDPRTSEAEDVHLVDGEKLLHMEKKATKFAKTISLKTDETHREGKESDKAHLSDTD
ncbi:hypothetical protein NDU88_007834 [Pleurodeles waltl]|uniref:Uncharacterized protein n=1 Tax=Pleurodeles waltl TaxID=8319 RepID=A0AAV7PMT1_PLEWA|nr:hypothetical protein NDU88_007834 [Pleurodeles waltl]